MVHKEAIDSISYALGRVLTPEEISFLDNSYPWSGSSGCFGCLMGDHEFPEICENALQLKAEYRQSLEEFLSNAFSV